MRSQRRLDYAVVNTATDDVVARFESGAEARMAFPDDTEFAVRCDPDRGVELTLHHGRDGVEVQEIILDRGGANEVVLYPVASYLSLDEVLRLDRQGVALVTR